MISLFSFSLLFVLTIELISSAAQSSAMKLHQGCDLWFHMNSENGVNETNGLSIVNRNFIVMWQKWPSLLKKERW
jgi:hypothetical protein